MIFRFYIILRVELEPYYDQILYLEPIIADEQMSNCAKVLHWEVAIRFLSHNKICLFYIIQTSYIPNQWMRVLSFFYMVHRLTNQYVHYLFDRYAHLRGKNLLRILIKMQKNVIFSWEFLHG